MKENIALLQDSVKVYKRNFYNHVSANPVKTYYSLIMTAALTAPRQWTLRADDVVVEIRV